jgi:mannitol/fructose-specific phosphotransferase system IIA component
LTEDGARSEWVNQEIGVAHGLGKDIIPIKEKGVDVKGFIEGVEWITLDRFNPDVALEKTSSYLRDLHHEKVNMVTQDGIAWGVLVGVVVGILAFILVTWAITRSD